MDNRCTLRDFVQRVGRNPAGPFQPWMLPLKQQVRQPEMECTQRKKRPFQSEYNFNGPCNTTWDVEVLIMWFEKLLSVIYEDMRDSSEWMGLVLLLSQLLQRWNLTCCVNDIQSTTSLPVPCRGTTIDTRTITSQQLRKDHFEEKSMAGYWSDQSGYIHALYRYHHHHHHHRTQLNSSTSPIHPWSSSPWCTYF